LMDRFSGLLYIIKIDERSLFRFPKCKKQKKHRSMHSKPRCFFISLLSIPHFI